MTEPSNVEKLAEFAASDTGLIQGLASMGFLDYARQRKEAARQLGIGARELDKLVAAQRKQLEAEEDPPFASIEPWPEPVAGSDILTDLARALKAHVVLPAGAATAIALWTLHAHTHDSADISPILGITSPAPECGKTTLLTLLGAVVPRPLPASNITSAALFRAVEKWHPTLLVDEADTFLRDSDELRGVVNSGHNKANAYVVRTVGDDHNPRHFKTWAPKALASIGKLAPTIASRTLHIELRRKGAGEQTTVLRPDRVEHLHILARKAARWAADNIEALKTVEPNLPATLSGRRADNWRHLLAIADLAGGVWPARAHKAAEVMAADDDNDVAGILLLQDLRDYFKEQKTDRVSSSALVEALHEMLDRPWPEWGKHGKPISEGQVAKLLKGFKVSPRGVRVGKRTPRGYLQEQFADVFDRYLTRAAPDVPSQGATPQQSGDINDLQGTATATAAEDVAVQSPSNPLENNNCCGVALPQGEAGEIRARDEGNGSTDLFQRVCEHCGNPETAEDPAHRYTVGGIRRLLHLRCREERFRM